MAQKTSRKLGKLISIIEVAELLGVSRATVWRWIQSKKIATVRLGSLKKPIVRIHEAEVEKLVSAGQKN